MSRQRTRATVSQVTPQSKKRKARVYSMVMVNMILELMGVALEAMFEHAGSSQHVEAFLRERGHKHPWLKAHVISWLARNRHHRYRLYLVLGLIPIGLSLSLLWAIGHFLGWSVVAVSLAIVFFLVGFLITRPRRT